MSWFYRGFIMAKKSLTIEVISSYCDPINAVRLAGDKGKTMVSRIKDFLNDLDSRLKEIDYRNATRLQRVEFNGLVQEIEICENAIKTISHESDNALWIEMLNTFGNISDTFIQGKIESEQATNKGRAYLLIGNRLIDKVTYDLKLIGKV
jgi:hypothetical protein